MWYIARLFGEIAVKSYIVGRSLSYTELKHQVMKWHGDGETPQSSFIITLH